MLEYGVQSIHPYSTVQFLLYTHEAAHTAKLVSRHCVPWGKTPPILSNSTWFKLSTFHTTAM
eukprot:1782633-Pyramimonas_sp.AAC.1